LHFPSLSASHLPEIQRLHSEFKLPPAVIR
jgi:hypothetical protein